MHTPCTFAQVVGVLESLSASFYLKKSLFVFTLLLCFTTKLKKICGIHPATKSQFPQNKPKA